MVYFLCQVLVSFPVVELAKDGDLLRSWSPLAVNVLVVIFRAFVHTHPFVATCYLQ